MRTEATSQASALAELIALHEAVADRLARSEDYLAMKALERAITALRPPARPGHRKLAGPTLPTFDLPAVAGSERPMR